MANEASSRLEWIEARDRARGLLDRLSRERAELQRPSLEALARKMDRAAGAAARLIECLDQSPKGTEEPSK